LDRVPVLLAAVLAASCAKAAASVDKPAPVASGSARGALVARVGTAELREDDVKRALARDPAAGAERFRSAQARRELVEGLVRFELLVQAAEHRGLTKDPDAVHALRQIAVTKLVNQALGAVASPDSIAPEDVQREYAARKSTDFTLPEAAHVRHIRVTAASSAARLVARARALRPDDDAGFAALATASSEDETTRPSGGDLGFVDVRSRLPQALIQAALGLRRPGEVGGPVEREGGFEILRLVSRRAAAVSPLSSVEASIRQQLYRERRAKALDDFIQGLRRETPVAVVEPNALGAVLPP
jgi:parvulin-like peptidyl-prolyl isomerase